MPERKKVTLSSSKDHDFGDYFESGTSVVARVPGRRPSFTIQASETVQANDEASFRKGKWTTEEEDYANKIISLFNRGLLPIGAGITLRSYLSDKLHCDPMRITKKFAGASCIGKQVFQPTGALSGQDCSSEIDELKLLERSFYLRVGDKGTSSSMRTSSDDDCDGPSNPHSSYKKNRVRRISDGLSSMRSVVSAPDFSELQLMHNSLDDEGGKRKLGVKRKQRSQSVMDLLDFEHYISDDSAAGNLLMQFVSRMNDDEDSAEVDGNNDDGGPVTKFVSLSTIGQNNGSSSEGSKDGKSSVIFDRAISSRIDTDGLSDTAYPGLFKSNRYVEDDGDMMVDQSSSHQDSFGDDPYDCYEKEGIGLLIDDVEPIKKESSIKTESSENTPTEDLSPTSGDSSLTPGILPLTPGNVPGDSITDHPLKDGTSKVPTLLGISLLLDTAIEVKNESTEDTDRELID
mmetsp:Transcript_32482/g.30962  ORF Transcript_32482/g.30962 Transcript_32482/m.30962 type:complete len:459 (-) Transcript_32482:267-1643(-)|eukprot:CAMPEP_0119045272 /NCGR_PEP_ID=MMETSP1177-20130426/38622_1 /TAXON_ID=2985 /ORGANISM="Ochromonas sp, Strain CCMP1899" /LENGTH=458 /DNA_ID=CAMNT_0007016779 /DNA_START=196 /DNA_END=1572 /DNA_ORIENTATION=+